jgi:hypothetical protein
MGIQINGQTDNISATDGSLTISGAELPTVTNLNATGIVTAASFSGDGSNLTGIAATTDVRTNSLVVSGITTVAAGSTAAPSISPSGDNNTGIFFPSPDTIAFAEGGAEAFRVDSSGRFGLGTISLDSRFVIRSHSGVSDTPILKIEHPTNDADFAISGLYDTDGNVTYLGSNLYLNSSFALTRFDTGKPSSAITLSGRTGNGEITFLTGSGTATERMRITSAGMVNIKSDSGYDNGITYDNSANSSKQHFDRIVFGASSYYIVNNSLVGVRLDSASTSWSTQSDERFKTALQNIENGLDKVATLRSVTGRYLSDDENVSRSFLIAQDVAKVLPEAVSEEADDTKTLGIRYTEVIPLLVAALKESKERIESLEAEVAALKAS